MHAGTNITYNYNNVYMQFLHNLYPPGWQKSEVQCGKRVDIESKSMPSTEALLLHWKRCTWVLAMWHTDCHSEPHRSIYQVREIHTYVYIHARTCRHRQDIPHIHAYIHVCVLCAFRVLIKVMYLCSTNRLWMEEGKWKTGKNQRHL